MIEAALYSTPSDVFVLATVAPQTKFVLWMKNVSCSCFVDHEKPVLGLQPPRKLCSIRLNVLVSGILRWLPHDLLNVLNYITVYYVFYVLRVFCLCVAFCLRCFVPFVLFTCCAIYLFSCGSSVDDLVVPCPITINFISDNGHLGQGRNMLIFSGRAVNVICCCT